MIYFVTEWYDSDSNQFFFDTSKVDLNNKFEKTYFEFLQKAAKNPLKILDITKNTHLIKDRFDIYQNESDLWEKLLAKFPCIVDDKIELIIS